MRDQDDDTPPQQNCSGCRWWSEMIARSAGSGVEAVCLNSKSRFHTKWTRERQVCAEWGANTMGAIDEPGQPEDILDLYANADDYDATAETPDA